METDRITHLLARLDAIGEALAASGHGLALLGLGSVGLQRDRLDAYSDLDYFAIVQPGTKHHYLADHAWLNRPCPVVYCFQNTRDGFKYLYEDGIFCEMAVFEPDELAAIPFAPGRVIWQADGFDPAALTPPPHRHEVHTLEWHLGEALTNLYVGLARHHRGEILSAQRFVQHYAVDRALALAAERYAPRADVHPDPYMNERRVEQRYPALAELLPTWVQGYDRVPQSARAVLAFLVRHFEVNAAMKAQIEALLATSDPA